MSDAPFDALVGHAVDTVSFVRDYVELRIDYSVIRFLTDPSGSVDGEEWRLTGAHGADMLRRYIGRVVATTEFDERAHLRLEFDDGAIIRASLRDDDRTGPEALHFMPADSQGKVHASNMHIW